MTPVALIAPRETATDAELVELFSLDSVDELHAIAAGKRGMLFIDTCDGRWAKYEGQGAWRFQHEEPDPS